MTKARVWQAWTADRDALELLRVRSLLVDGAAAGMLATLLVTAITLLGPAMAGRPLAALGVVPPPWDRPAALVSLGLLHLTYGALAGGLYRAGTRTPSVASALRYALGLWALAVFVYVPSLGGSARLAPRVAAAALAAHLAYGFALAVLLPREARLEPQPRSGLAEA